MKYVLNELTKKELDSFFGYNELLILRYFINKSLLAQPELLPGQKPIPIHIPKEHIEQWIVQALGVEALGAGSYPIDVYSKKDGWGADIKMVSAKVDEKNNLLTKYESGETSLAQKFQGAGQDLDQLFIDNKLDIIRSRWLNLFREKYEKIYKEKNINKIYYFFFIRAGKSFFLVGLKLNLDNLKYVTLDSENNRKQAVVLNNFIDSKLGTTRIYKAKKRLELRLFPAQWESRNNYIRFDSNFNVDQVNLRSLISDENNLAIRLSEIASKVLFSSIRIQ